MGAEVQWDDIVLGGNVIMTCGSSLLFFLVLDELTRFLVHDLPHYKNFSDLVNDSIHSEQLC